MIVDVNRLHDVAMTIDNDNENNSDNDNDNDNDNDKDNEGSGSSSSGLGGIFDNVEDTMRSVGIDFSFN